MFLRNIIPVLVLAAVLGGCGLSVPNTAEVWDRDFPAQFDDKGKMIRPKIAASEQIAFEIKKQVYCELREAVAAVKAYHDSDKKQFEIYKKEGKLGKNPQLIEPLPENWGALVTFSVEVDDNASLNPGVGFVTPMHSAITHFIGEATPSSAFVGNGFTYPFLSSPQSYTFGLGGTLSSTATKTDKYDPFYTVKDLLGGLPHQFCTDDKADPFASEILAGTPPAKSSPLISGDVLGRGDGLGLKDWLVGATWVNKIIPSSQSTPTNAESKASPETKASLARQREDLRRQGYNEAEIVQIIAIRATPSDSSGASGSSGGGGATPKPDTLSHEIKFIMVSSGNVTPQWKLVRVSANTGAPFFGMGRTRTHDLIITFGPQNQKTADIHNSNVQAALNGSAIGNSTRAP